jgi:hypothetical protein
MGELLNAPATVSLLLAYEFVELDWWVRGDMNLSRRKKRIW